MFRERNLLLFYYLATPMFLLLDVLFGLNIRISALDTYPGWKIIYYLFLVCLGLAMWKWQILEPILGIFEGAVNMLLLTLSILLPYYQAIDRLSDAQPIEQTIDSFTIINYLIVGLFLVISMQIRHAKLKHL